MFNVGLPEMIVILLVALLVFGPNKLPEIARSMGKFLHNFQQETNRALSDLKAGIEPATTGIFDEPDPGPAAAIGAPAATRRKTSTSAPKTRRKPSTAKKKSASAAGKKPAPKTAPKKKPSAKKSSKR